MQSTDKLDPSIEFIPGIGISAINPRGSGDSVPRETFSPLLSTRFVRSAHSEIPFFRRTQADIDFAFAVTAARCSFTSRTMKAANRPGITAT